MTIAPTTRLQLDESTSVDVHMLPQNLRQLVELYDTWRRDEQRLAFDLMKVQAAMRDLTSTLNTGVSQYLAEPDLQTGALNATE